MFHDSKIEDCNCISCCAPSVWETHSFEKNGGYKSQNPTSLSCALEIGVPLKLLISEWVRNCFGNYFLTVLGFLFGSVFSARFPCYL
jgi:hypothetical protein